MTQTQFVIRFRCGSGWTARNFVNTRVYNSSLMLMGLAFRFGVATTDCASFMSISQSVSYSAPTPMNLRSFSPARFYAEPDRSCHLELVTFILDAPLINL